MKVFKHFLTALLAMLASYATADTYKVSSVEITPGQTFELPIELENQTEVCGFQFKLYLPEGIEWVYDNEEEDYTYTTTSRLTNKHKSSLAIDKMGDGGFLVYAYASGRVLSGNDGTIMTLTLKAADNITTSLKGYLRENEVSDMDEVGTQMPDVSFDLILKKVEQAVTVRATSMTREYGDANPTLEYTVEGGELLGGAPSLSCAATPSSPAGTYDIVVSRGTLTNSAELLTLINGTLTVTKAPLTISVGSYSRMEGEANPQFIVNYSGFKNGDNASVLTKLPTVTCEANASSAPGTYSIILSGAESDKYYFIYNNGTLTIEEKPEPKPEPGVVTVLADIDFSNDIVDGTVTGNVNTMHIDLSDENNLTSVVDGHLKLGNGTNTVTIPEEQRPGDKDKVQLKLNMAFGQLTGKNAFFNMKDAEGNAIVSFSYNCYQGTTENTLGITTDNLAFTNRGGGTWDNSVVSFDIIVDYATAIIQTTVTCANSKTGTAVYTTSLSNNNPVATFEVGSNYNNIGRACLFDDLYIQNTTGDYNAETAAYTVQFVYEGKVLRSFSRIGNVGSSITLTATDKAIFTYDGDQLKYVYSYDDADGKTIAADGSTVVTVYVVEVPFHSYYITGPSGYIIKYGEAQETDNVTVPYSRYIHNEGILYKAGVINKEFNYKFTMDTEDHRYQISYAEEQLEEGESVAYISEGEDIAGTTPSNNTSNVAIRASRSGAAYATGDVVICNLQAGSYRMVVGVFDASKNGNETTLEFKNDAGDILYTAQSTATNLSEQRSGVFTLAIAQDIILSAGGDNTHCLDYLYIVNCSEHSGILDVMADSNMKDKPVYNLHGQKQMRRDNLQRGIYVVGGKKVIIK